MATIKQRIEVLEAGKDDYSIKVVILPDGISESQARASEKEAGLRPKGFKGCIIYGAEIDARL
jgi:hypothetical protein